LVTVSFVLPSESAICRADEMILWKLKIAFMVVESSGNPFFFGDNYHDGELVGQLEIGILFILLLHGPATTKSENRTRSSCSSQRSQSSVITLASVSVSVETIQIFRFDETIDGLWGYFFFLVGEDGFVQFYYY
jgi:hypothetical protein